MNESEKLIKEIFGSKTPVECPRCGSSIMSTDQHKKVWYDKEEGEVKSGECTTTIRYWCGSSFTIGNGCKK